MKHRWQEKTSIKMFTYLLGLLACTLLVLLSWLFIRSYNIDMHQYTQMTLLIQDLNREDSVLKQEILSIQEYDTDNFKHYFQSQQKIKTLIKALRKEDEQAILSADFLAYEKHLSIRYVLNDQFLGCHTNMRMAMLSLPKVFDVLPAQLDASARTQVQALIRFSFHYHAHHSDEVKNKTLHLAKTLASQPWANHPELQSIFKNVVLFIQHSDQRRVITKQILALSGTENINHMQNTIQEQHQTMMRFAKSDSMTLYIISMLLVLGIIIIIVHLRRIARRLHKTVMDLHFQQSALDEHAIVSITDANGFIIYANEQFLISSQYSEDELIGNNHNIINANYHSNDFFKELWDTISSGHIWHGEMCNRRKDGRLIWMRTTIVPFVDEGQKPQRYIAIRTDISYHKENESELQQHRAQLKEQIRQRTLSLQQSVRHLKQEIQTRKSVEHQLRCSVEAAQNSVRLKSEFIANMNHELRTPLNAIIGFSDLLREGLVGSLTETQIDYINDIFDSGNRLLHLISDIMDLSKIESGMVEYEPEPVIFEDVLQNSLGMIKSKAMNHQIQIHIEVDSSIEMVVLDVRKVKQILFNLLSNAVKFTADMGEITIHASICEEDKNPAMLSIAIRDTGIGISENDLLKIFGNFMQLDGAIDRQFEGTGLGLSLVKQLVELHHGTIEVSSELGVGSCFTVKVPYQTTCD